MNVAMFNQVADAIESEPQGYNQEYVGRHFPPGWEGKTCSTVMNPCETPCCIAGWAAYLADPEGEYGDDNEVIDRGREALEITEDEAMALFASSWPVHWADEISLDGLTEDEKGSAFWSDWNPGGKAAPRVLREMAKRGTVFLGESNRPKEAS